MTPRIFAVMGPTGSGKSSFISAIAPGAARVGHSLVSCTDTVHTVDVSVDGVDCIFIDTPGFDDTHKSDATILRMIANYLEVSYQAGMQLNGIIYFHRISDNRVGGVSAKNIRLFRALVGQEALHNVILCTTMWDIVPARDAETREAELRRSFWLEMISNGSAIVRHNGSPPSALKIIRPYLWHESAPVQLQKELARHVPLINTAPGVQLQTEITAAQHAHKVEFGELQKEKDNAKSRGDWQYERQIDAELAEEREKLRKLQEEMEKLIQDRNQEIARLKQELKRQRDCC